LYKKKQKEKSGKTKNKGSDPGISKNSYIKFQGRPKIEEKPHGKKKRKGTKKQRRGTGTPIERKKRKYKNQGKKNHQSSSDTPKGEHSL